MNTHNTLDIKTTTTKKTRKLALTGALLVGALTLSGCDNAGQGLFSGAALGAVTGLALGSLRGNAGEGAVAGTIIGGAGGAILGDINERERYNARYGNTHYSSDYDNRYRHDFESRSRYDRRHRTHYSGYNSHRGWWNDNWCD
ncbi:MAG: glycine zipper domain-containing protein [Phycisphaerales bacterium]